MATFDPVQYKTTTRQQWEDAAEAWHRWGQGPDGVRGPVRVARGGGNQVTGTSPVTVAAVQAAPVFLDRETTVERASPESSERGRPKR